MHKSPKPICTAQASACSGGFISGDSDGSIYTILNRLARLHEQPPDRRELIEFTNESSGDRFLAAFGFATSSTCDDRRRGACFAIDVIAPLPWRIRGRPCSKCLPCFAMAILEWTCGVPCAACVETIGGRWLWHGPDTTDGLVSAIESCRVLNESAIGAGQGPWIVCLLSIGVSEQSCNCHG